MDQICINGRFEEWGGVRTIGPEIPSTLSEDERPPMAVLSLVALSGVG